MLLIPSLWIGLLAELAIDVDYVFDDGLLVVCHGLLLLGLV